MKTWWILVFFVISLFFISGQAGCETLQTQPSTGPVRQEIPTSGVFSMSSTFPGINIETIKIVPFSLKENIPFNIIVDLKNNGKAVDPIVKLWAPDQDLGVLISPEEQSVSLGDAVVDGKLEPKKQSIISGEYVYTNLISDVKPDLKIDVSANYNVNIIPPKGICVAKESSMSKCGEKESMTGSNLGDEASMVPITVSSIEKIYTTSLKDKAYLELKIYLSDVGQGSGFNEYVNNFDASLSGRVNLDCGGVRTVSLKESPITCHTTLDLVQEEDSYQLIISFDYDYLIKKTITLDVKREKKASY